MLTMTERPETLNPAADKPCVLVSPWTVLMAVRYGLGRQTYAHADALVLLRRHWDLLEQFKPSLVADLEWVARNDLLPPDVRQSAQDTLAWIEMKALV